MIAMIIVATYASVEEAEEFGEWLLANGITPQIRNGQVLVPAADANRALDILNRDLQERPESEPEPYHPCPSCGTGDPLWYGKRKVILLLVLFAVTLGSTRWGALIAIGSLAAGTVLFMLAAMLIPEFECRNCHRRWTKQPDADEEVG